MRAPVSARGAVLRRCLLVLALLMPVLGALAQSDSRVPSPPVEELRARIEGVRGQLQAAQRTLDTQTLDDRGLVDLRSEIEAPTAAARQAAADLQPRIDALRARLEQLGPRPEGENAPAEPAETAALRAALEQQRRDLEGLLALARSEVVVGEQLAQRIVDQRRQLLARALLQRSDSLLSPQLWIAVARALPGEQRALAFMIGDWQRRVGDRMDLATVGWLLAGSAVAAGLILIVWRRLRRLVTRDPAYADPPRLKRALAALQVLLVWTLVPMIVCGGALLMLNGLDLLTARVRPIVESALLGLVLVAFAYGLADGLLTPRHPSWRLVEVDDDTAAVLLRLAVSFSLVVAIGQVMEALLRALFAVLAVSVAVKATIGALAGLVILVALRGFGRAEQEGEEAEQGARAGLPLRLLGWITALALLGSSVTGYAALAHFLTNQVAWIVTIAAILKLTLVFIEEGFGREMAPEGRLGRAIRTQSGLKSRSLKQVSILLSGLASLIAITAALLLVLAPWGLDGADLWATVRGALFGFTVGGVSISLSTIVIAFAMFAFGFIVTRRLQAWLDHRYLPHTGLDLGLRNSITTILGYVGVFVAAMLALSALGLSIDRLAIVAGALSVGIGFGLQSIVNNFVSGLILLWERPIRVGDVVTVGGDTGVIRRIDVRATEIQTYDRSSLIVPNAEFISGRVKNLTHGDRVARLIIPIGVHYDSDPEKVRDILLGVALGHREVLSEPPPRVFFMKFGDFTLDFELRCFTDVDSTLTVRSDLHFEIHRQLKAAAIEIPYPLRNEDRERSALVEPPIRLGTAPRAAE